MSRQNSPSLMTGSLSMLDSDHWQAYSYILSVAESFPLLL